MSDIERDMVLTEKRFKRRVGAMLAEIDDLSVAEREAAAAAAAATAGPCLCPRIFLI